MGRNKERVKGSRQAFGPRTEGSHHQTRGSNSCFPNGLVSKVRTLEAQEKDWREKAKPQRSEQQLLALNCESTARDKNGV